MLSPISIYSGTRVCMAPEVVRQNYTLSADLWSTGILAYLLLTGRLPFAKGERQSELYVTKQVGEPVLFPP
jgi:serine/threonine protein kinase